MVTLDLDLDRDRDLQLHLRALLERTGGLHCTALLAALYRSKPHTTNKDEIRQARRRGDIKKAKARRPGGAAELVAKSCLSLLVASWLLTSFGLGPG